MIMNLHLYALTCHLLVGGSFVLSIWTTSLQTYSSWSWYPGICHGMNKFLLDLFLHGLLSFEYCIPPSFSVLISMTSMKIVNIICSSCPWSDHHFMSFRLWLLLMSGVYKAELCYFCQIENYMKNTHAKTHSGYTVDIVQIFRASRGDETERFQKVIANLP